MTIHDKLYGTIEITDPLIQQIINLPIFQRLKHINQYGGVNFVYTDKYQTTRFEHSIGVWYVLKKLDAELEIQIAGLLHDVGHTAFSHLLDQAMENASENYHEQYTHLLEGYEELQNLLNENNVVLQDVDSYSEIKTSLPLVGSDRFDYALRDFAHSTLQYDDFPTRAVVDIILKGRKLVFQTLDIAEEFARRGLQAMWNVIYDPNIAIIYQSAVELIREGINESTITPTDLIKTDKDLLDKILKQAESFNPTYIKVFKEKFKAEIVDSEPYDFVHVKLKARYFDPLVQHDGEINQLSTFKPEFKLILDEFIEKFERRKIGEKIRIIYS